MTTSKIATASSRLPPSRAAGAVALGLASPADAAARPYGDSGRRQVILAPADIDDCALMSAADVIGPGDRQEPSDAPSSKWPSRHPASCTPGPFTQSRSTPPELGNGYQRRHTELLRLRSTPLSPTRTTPPRLAALEQYSGQRARRDRQHHAEMIWGQPVEETDAQPAV